MFENCVCLHLGKAWWWGGVGGGKTESFIFLAHCNDCLRWPCVALWLDIVSYTVRSHNQWVTLFRSQNSNPHLGTPFGTPTPEFRYHIHLWGVPKLGT